MFLMDFFSPLGPLEPFGASWGPLESPGRPWNLLKHPGLPGTLWNHLEPPAALEPFFPIFQKHSNLQVVNTIGLVGWMTIALLINAIVTKKGAHKNTRYRRKHLSLS